MSTENEVITLDSLKELYDYGGNTYLAKDELGNFMVVSEEEEGAGVVLKGITTEGTGILYTANVPDISALEVGISFIMIPHTANTNASRANLNVNDLGVKAIRRRLSRDATK